MSEKILVPDIGDFENVEVIEILVKEGQEIKKNDPVVTIESDKSSVEIPSSLSGKIESIKVKVGDKVSKGDLLLNISNFKHTPPEPKDVPRDTENLIQEAENSLKKKQEQQKPNQKIERLQVCRNGLNCVIPSKYPDLFKKKIFDEIKRTLLAASNISFNKI